jgi:hypothetical protein
MGPYVPRHTKLDHNVILAWFNKITLTQMHWYFIEPSHRGSPCPAWTSSKHHRLSVSMMLANTIRSIYQSWQMNSFSPIVVFRGLRWPHDVCQVDWCTVPGILQLWLYRRHTLLTWQHSSQSNDLMMVSYSTLDVDKKCSCEPVTR